MKKILLTLHEKKYDMKKTLFILCSLTFPLAGISQVAVNHEYKTEKSVTYFDNTEIKMSEGYLTDGQQHGKWIYYYKNGKVYREAEFYMGVINGRVTYYWENGKIQSDGYIYNNKLNGSYKEYYEDGTLAKEGKYFDNKKDSVWQTFNIVGRLKLRENCEKGLCKVIEAFDNSGSQMVKDGFGKFKDYFPDGKTVREEGNYKNGLKDSLWITYFENKNTASKITYKDGIPTGRIFTFYESGAKKSEEHAENGEYLLWYENGKLKTKGLVKNSLREDKWSSFNQNGDLLSEINYQNGEKNGHAIWYRLDTSNKKKPVMLKDYEGDFKNGVQTGHWIYYQADGTKGNEGEYVDGKMSGLWTWYYEGGKVWKKGIYKNGEKNGEYTVYFENGNVYYTGNFVNGKEEGFWKRYFENGKPEIQGSFHAGQMDSVWKEWFPNGVLKYEITYKNDLKNGIVIYYDETGLKTLIQTFTDGVLNGKFTQFNETGVAVIDGSYFYDKKDGQWLYRQADQKIIRKEFYKNGRPTGTWQEFYPNGNLQSQKSFNKNGVLDGKFIKYDRYGKVTYEAVYSGGQLSKVIFQQGQGQQY